ncbi:hypothetical protein [Thiobacillus denitrificans]|uniref:hypothetical protein n=1 Tax=Thiobacillus denitrificans TaxID=36861 RepID=UPI0012F7B1AB|nr:hypothetical protein [Thiobacillus denitrificans]
MGDASLTYLRYLARRESTIQAGLAAVKTAVLITGGTAAALLTFIGHLATQKGSDQVKLLACPLLLFSLALLSVGVASGMTYLSERATLQGKGFFYKSASFFNIVAAACVLLAYVFYGWGAWETYEAFSKFPQGTGG